MTRKGIGNTISKSWKTGRERLLLTYFKEEKEHKWKSICLQILIPIHLSFWKLVCVHFVFIYYFPSLPECRIRQVCYVFLQRVFYLELYQVFISLSKKLWQLFFASFTVKQKNWRIVNFVNPIDFGVFFSASGTGKTLQSRWWLFWH